MKKKIRIAVGQMNPTAGDYASNTRKILAWVKKAEEQGADFVIFPEMALCGYPVWDLAGKASFIDEGLRYLETIVQATRKLHSTVVLGFIDHSERRRRSRNALAVIYQGHLKAKYYKRLLPTYDVFLEEIYFDPGDESPVVTVGGTRLGFTICEDIWDEPYAIKPVSELASKGAELILNISASPYFKGVAQRRDELIKKHALRTCCPMLYVNQTGAQDELIFDGRSLFADSQGRILFRAPAFEEGLFFFDWQESKKKQPAVPPLIETGSPAEIYHALVLGIQDYCRKNRFERVVLGLSGGIDSALVAVLAHDALGAKNVLGITMPSPYSSKGSWQDSQDLARHLKIEFQKHPITQPFRFLSRTFKKVAAQSKAGKSAVDLALENLQARLRGLELMFVSNSQGRLLLSTGNKSEIAMGYCTLYGDMCGGLAVLGDVYKTDVYKLAHYRNSLSKVIPEPILTKAPSAELRPNQKDQDSLPPYDILDEILYLYIEKNLSIDEIAAAMKAKKIAKTLVAEVVRKVDHNEYKRRQTPPILRVTEKAWFGRRMPITNHFQG